MFRIITVEREYGAGGSLVAAELAHRKGWQLLDQQLTGEIARMAAVDHKVVARCDEKVDPPLHRLAKVLMLCEIKKNMTRINMKINQVPVPTLVMRRGAITAAPPKR